MSSTWWTTERAVFATMTHMICRTVDVAATAPACGSRGCYVADTLMEAMTSRISVRLCSRVTVMREVDALIIFHHSIQAMAHCHVCPSYL